MADDSTTRHLATLQDLNHHFVRSVGEADVAWFDRHLSDDFHNTNPDGTLIDRAAFDIGGRKRKRHIAFLAQPPGEIGMQQRDAGKPDHRVGDLLRLRHRFSKNADFM
jgi:hypothetical protein